MAEQEQKEPSVKISLIPIVFLIGIMVVNVIVFKDNATFGPNQFALILTAILAAGIGVFHLKMPYAKLEKTVVSSIMMSMQAMLILFVVGALIAVWILSGIVPIIIYYGVQIIHPSVFLFVCCITSCIVSLATGSSWSTSGTIGIALIAIGQTLGIPLGMVAGAVISGAYFGDKMSPMSDTTNLAPAMVGTDLFTHIRHMMYTSGPAIILALLGFLLLGFFFHGEAASTQQIDEVLMVIQSHFNLNPVLLLVPVLVVTMVAKKVPALPSLIFGVLLGVLAALILQMDLLVEMAGDHSDSMAIYAVILSTAADGFAIETGNEVIDSLFSRGGMAGMLNTI